MQFKFIDYGQGLAQIGQQINTQFAFAQKVDKGTYQNAMPFVKCRDFFGDVLLAKETGKKQGIYGFSFDPDTMPLDTDKTRIIVQFDKPEHKKAFKQNRKHYAKTLRALSNDVGYGIMYNLDDNHVLIVADKFWMESVANISWFTFVLKCWSFPELEQTDNFFDAVSDLKVMGTDWAGKPMVTNTNESGYMNAVRQRIETFLANIKELNKELPYKSGYKDVKAISIVHNNSGFKAVVHNLFEGNLISQRLGKLLV